MPETALTSALNATVITGDGNEGLLQNDMGNTLIKDSITGNIMSLNDGFIPLGMKEYGGILYIASYNPQTNEGELGTIPSPIIHYTAQDFSDIAESITITDLITETGKGETLQERLNSNLIYLSDNVFHGGDKFIVALNLEGIDNTYSRTNYIATEQLSLNFKESTEYPVISTTNKRGWYKVKLYAVTDSGKEILLDEINQESQSYFVGNQQLYSDYWFIESKELTNLDLDRTRLQNCFRTYPNIPSGRLAIKFELELHEPLQYLTNQTYEEGYPNLYIKFDASDSKNNTNYVIINGFSYKADCPIQPDMIKIRCNNGTFDFYTLTVSDNKVTEKTLIGKELTAIVNKNNILRLTKQYTFPFITTSENNIQAQLGCTLVKEKNDEGIEESKYVLSRKLPLQFETRRFPAKAMIDVAIEGANSILNIKNQDINYTSTGLLAIKVDELNTDLQFSVDLYVKNPNTQENNALSYIFYRTDYLPRYNPALAAIKDSEGLEQVFKDQYLQFETQDDTFDVKLFNNYSKTLTQKCFIYDEDEDETAGTNLILEYDDSLKKYIPKDEIENNQGYVHTLENYKNLRSWIYPQVICRLESDNTLKTDTDAVRLAYTYAPEYNRDNTSLSGSIIYKNYYAFIYDIHENEFKLDNTQCYLLADQFVVASEQPIVHGKHGNTIKERKLLVPIYDASDFQRQQNFFKKHINEFGLTPEDLKNNCIYSVNLNTINKDLSDKFFKDKDLYLKGKWNKAGKGIENNILGVECFWSKNNGLEKPPYNDYYDQALVYYDGEGKDFVPSDLESNKQGIIGRIPSKYPWDGGSSGFNDSKADFYRMHQDDQELISDRDWRKPLGEWPWFNYGGAITYAGTHLSGVSVQYSEAYPPSFLRQLTFFCPGYFSNTSRKIARDILDTTTFFDLRNGNTVLREYKTDFKIVLNIFDYKHPPLYLYTKPLYVNLQNHGNNYIKAFISQADYDRDNKGFDFNINETYNTIINGTTYSSTNTINGHILPIEELEDRIKKVEINSGILSAKVNRIGFEDSTYFKQIDYSLSAQPTKKGNIILPINYVASPSIFISITKDSLNLPYKAEYQLATQLYYNNYGYYANVLIPANIHTINFLRKASSETIGYETLIDIKGIQGKLYKPKDFITSGYVGNQSINVEYSGNNAPGLRSIKRNSLNNDFSTISNKGVNFKNYGVNSFCNIEGFLQLNQKNVENKVILDTTLHLSEGQYVFCVNYNYDYTDYNNPKFELSITNANTNSVDFIEFCDKYCIAFSVSDGDYNIKLRYSLNKSSEKFSQYIKNIGLYTLDWQNQDTTKYLDDADKITDEDFTIISSNVRYLNNNKYNGIIFPASFCYKEEQVDSNGNIEQIGCLSKTFGGFQELPNYAYQRFEGSYRINLTTNTPVIDVDSLDRAPEDVNNSLKEIKIRHIIENDT